MIKKVQDHFKDVRTLVFEVDDSMSALQREAGPFQGKFSKLVRYVKNTEQAPLKIENVLCGKLTKLWKQTSQWKY